MKKLIFVILVIFTCSLIGCSVNETTKGENKDLTNDVTEDNHTTLDNITEDTQTEIDYDSLSDVEKIIYNLEHSQSVTINYSYTHPLVGYRSHSVKIMGDLKMVNDGTSYLLHSDSYYIIDETNDGYVAYKKFPSDTLSYVDVDLKLLLDNISTDSSLIDGYIDISVELFNTTNLRLYITDYFVTRIEILNDETGVEFLLSDYNQTSFEAIEYTILTGVDAVEHVLGLDGYQKQVQSDGVAFFSQTKGTIYYHTEGNYVEVESTYGGDYTYYLDTRLIQYHNNSYTVDEFAGYVPDVVIFEIFDLLG